MLVRSIVAQGDPNGVTLAGRLSEALDGKGVDRLDVAVAYATQQGLVALRATLGEWPAKTRWVVGLDDAITQPKAIDSLLALNGAQLRLARLGPARRFHPKMYCFWASGDPSTCVAATGSANMTEHGLSKNGEVATILEAESEDDALSLKHAWEQLNSLGQDAAVFDLVEYRALHQRARRARIRMAKTGAIPPQPEANEPVPAELDFDGTAPTASVAWIDFGKAMGHGRELEMRSTLMPFFGIAQGSPTPQDRRFSFGGIELVMPFKKWTGKKMNEMWRINFTTAVPGSEILIRPIVDGVELRSNKTAVFERLADGSFGIRFLSQGTAEYAQLVARTQQQGVFGQTTARSYGFY